MRALKHVVVAGMLALALTACGEGEEAAEQPAAPAEGQAEPDSPQTEQ